MSDELSKRLWLKLYYYGGNTKYLIKIRCVGPQYHNYYNTFCSWGDNIHIQMNHHQMRKSNIIYK